MAEGILPNLRAARQMLADERMNRANIIGNLGPGGHGALAGGLLAEGIGGLMGAPQDPRLAKAAAFQQVEAEMRDLGLQPGTPEFTKTLYQKMLKVGQSEALEAYQFGLKAEQDTAEVEGIRQAPERRVRTLVSLGVPPQQAMDIAPNDDVYRDTVKTLAKPDKGPASFQEYELAQQIPGYADYLRQQKEAGATRVSVDNYFTKPLGKDAVDYVMPDGSAVDPRMTSNQAVAEGARVVTPAEKAAATTQANIETKRADATKVTLEAVQGMQGVAASLSSGSLISPVDRGRYDNQRRRLAKAIVQSRSPPGVEASQAAEQAMYESLPSIELVVSSPQSLSRIVDDILRESGGAGEQRIPIYNPQTGQFE